MLRSEWSESRVKSIAGHRGLTAVCRLAACCLLLGVCATSARAQGTSEFTLTADPFSPDAVAPSGVSSSQLTVGLPTGSSTNVTVNLTCQVSAPQGATNPPTCAVSPASVATPGSASVTITTQSTTSTEAYSVTVTGTGPTTTYTTPALPITVLAVSPQFTITIATAIAPTSVPAGQGATGTVTVNPVYGYATPTGGGITLACSSITPLVTIAPVCSFTYPNNSTTLQLNGTTSATATVNITTFGPIPAGANQRRGAFGLWLWLPLLGLVSFGAAAGGKRARGAWVLMTLMLLCGVVMLTPGCGNSTNTTSTTTPNGVTPANSYTFTIAGVDSNGVVSSNSSTTTTAPTVSLTVTAPPKTP